MSALQKFSQSLPSHTLKNMLISLQTKLTKFDLKIPGKNIWAYFTPISPWNSKGFDFKLTKWQVDQMLSLRNAELMKWLGTVGHFPFIFHLMFHSHNKLMRWQVDEILSWWKYIVMKWQVNEMASWWNVKLMAWQVDEMASWWNGKLTR